MNTQAHVDLSGVRWIAVENSIELQRTASQRVIGAAERAIEQRGEFLIVLAGGDTPRGVYRALRSVATDWSRWHVYFGDERCVPPGDADRNSRMAATNWLDHVAIPRGLVQPIPAERGAHLAALAYADTLSGVGDFDLVLLGLGQDGHTASLFPEHDWGAGRDGGDVLAVFDAPKPPRERVSLSAARLSRAREVIFLVSGEVKRDAVSRWRAGQRLPAAAIRPKSGVDALIESALLTPVSRP